MAVDELHSPREARDHRTPLHLAMTFEGDALVLGVGTRLGLANRGLLLRNQRSEAFDEARVAALLAAAYGRAIGPSELAYIRGALEKQSEDQTPLALVYLALADLPKLQPPAEAAWRLAAADELMKGGMARGESPGRSESEKRREKNSFEPTTPISRACPPATDARAGNGRAGTTPTTQTMQPRPLAHRTAPLTTGLGASKLRTISTTGRSILALSAQRRPRKLGDLRSTASDPCTTPSRRRPCNCALSSQWIDNRL